MVIDDTDHSHSALIDPSRARFPYCIVWSPLPVISWFIPFIGHVGICREDGVILDFAGPNFVCVDNFTFGAATRYIQITPEKCSSLPAVSEFDEDNRGSKDEHGRDLMTWDNALRKATQEFQHLNYNLFTCNCHSFVANNLNRLGFRFGRWNVVNLAILFLSEGRWVNKGAIIKTILPFCITFGLGLLLGGPTFLTMWAAATFLLVGWFILGTYCFRNTIHL
ncbi:hypothetical protein MLD38_007787 [Melastoma candidum]|uniref:Uncharacterized protein n=1 Tax=Melastoma candidum TaxID=119954 RepID=A0ACB9RV90_9MYRT|nr:hypothetical protein MLD38_007787 [Melastoma candidum]